MGTITIHKGTNDVISWEIPMGMSGYRLSQIKKRPRVKQAKKLLLESEELTKLEVKI